MLTSALTTMRQPRYAALSALMLVVALACVGAGTWQIVRFDDKRAENADLRGNARAAAVPVADLLPVTGAPGPAKDAVEYRTVTATGSYDPSAQTLVRNRTVDGKDGLLIVTPLRTGTATLLVVRGFVEQIPNGEPPTTIAEAPAGPVTVQGRIHLAETTDDGAGQLPDGQVSSINPVQQAQRLGAPMLDGYVELMPRQPGTRGLITLPGPDLSNPAGGAVEPQHFAYIMQWYLFALLALAAPFVLARAERKEKAASEPATGTGTPEQALHAKLADRYGR